MKYKVGDNIDFVLDGIKTSGEIYKTRGFIFKKYILSFEDKRGAHLLTWSVPNNRILGFTSKG